MRYQPSLFKTVQRSFLLIAVLFVAGVFDDSPAFAQEQNLPQEQRDLRVLPASSRAAKGKLILESARTGMRVPEFLSMRAPHLMAMAPMAPPPPPPSSVTAFQPNISLGGRTVAIDVSPSNTAVAIAASESGGLFLTTDSGATWTHVDTLQPFRMSDVKFAPSNGQIVIASAWADSQTTNGGGIWRSVDGGATWQRPATSNPPCSARASTWGISFAPGANDVYVGTDCGVAVSHDLGATWTHVLLSRTWSIATSPGGIVDTCSNDGHHRSTNSGGIFGAANLIGPAGSLQNCSGLAVHGIAASPFEPNVLFAVDVGPVTPAPNACSTMNAVRFQLLSESDDGGINWNQIGQACPSRPPWVGLHRSTDGMANHFDLYFSGGLDTRRETCTGFGGPGLRCATLPSTPNVITDHSDHNGMAFTTSTTSNCPEFIVSDGGVHRTSDCGANWTITGGGNSGYNALQLYEVDGQVHPGHTDLYFGTQDNNIWASGDNGATWPNQACCEGFFFQISHSSASDAGQTATGVFCFACSNFQSAAHFTSISGWPNPAGTVTGNPFLVGPAEYIQFNQPTPPSNTLNLTTNTGGTWTAQTTIAQTLSGRPYVSGPSAGPTIYQGIQKPGNVIGLRSITGVGTGTVTVNTADTGLLNIGSYCMGQGTFVCPTVFGVDPNNPLHLIAADRGTNQMKFTTDGGNTWTPDPVLTTLITANGKFLFFEPNFGLQAHAIAFDPTNGNRILVGTEANGIIASLDGGQTWGPLFESNEVTDITSFFFDEVQNDILVSSYGRGLWKLSIVPRPTALAYTGDTSQDYHDTANLAAVLTDTSVSPAVPILGVTVTFTLGTQSCSAKTDINGLAACPVTLNQIPGSYSVSASFAGNGLYLASSTSSAFTITKEETTLTYTGDTLIANGFTAHLSAVLKEDGVVPIAGRMVTFSLGSVTPQTCFGSTDGSGTAQCVISPVAQPLGPGTVSANFAGDPFYLPSSASATTLIFAFLNRGSFVVGNRTATGPVTFWSAQWSKANSLSSGQAPPSFKGFASNLSATPPSCGGSWTTSPGNSPAPPASVPSFMAVIASSRVSKSGNTISGDIPAIVIVETAPGYAPNPGHPGTGKVLAVFCGTVSAAAQPVREPRFPKIVRGRLVNPPISQIRNRPVPLESTTNPLPYLQLVGTLGIAGQVTAFSGNTVTVFGSGFCATGCSPLTLAIGDHLVGEAVRVGADGTFKTTFTLDEIPGRYIVTASQKAADGSQVMDSAPLVVPVGDEVPEIIIK